MDSLTRLAEKRVGTVLRERWTIDALVGCGAMAAVYKATHRNGNEVAIKMLHEDVSHDEGIRKRFQREGYAANKVRHKCAVTVFDDDVAEDGSAFLVMELLHGENMEARRERLGGYIPLPEVLGIADQLLDVLAAAHEQGVVHRDIKPENLFLTTDGVVKVLDFGIARLQRSSAEASSVTMVGTMLGTPGFMAPEQARGMTLAVDHQTDLFGVGATLFTLLSGEHVHRAETMEESLVLAATKPARSLAIVLPDMHPGVVALVDRALAWDKRDRFPDARSMQRELREVASRVLSGGSSLDLPEALSGPVVPSEREPPTRIMHLPEEREEPPTSKAPFSEEPQTLRRPLPRPAPARPKPPSLPLPLLVIAAAAAVLVAIALGLVLWIAVVARERPDEPAPSGTVPAQRLR